MTFAGIDTALWRNGVVLAPTVGMFDGTPLSFAKMPPLGTSLVTGTQSNDYTFIAGGGVLKKVSPLGVVSDWGIAPPPDGFTAAKISPSTKTISTFENAAAWTAVNCTLADEATIRVQGTNSMKLSSVASKTCTATISVSLNLDIYATILDPSSDADYISLYFRVDFPENIDSIQIRFTSGLLQFTKLIPVQTTVVQTAVPGVASLSSVADTQTTFKDNATDGTLFTAEENNLTKQMEAATISMDRNTWQQLRIPKLSFTTGTGTNGSATWSVISSLELTVSVNSRGSVNCYFDDMKMSGGSGMQGRYRYLLTFRNLQGNDSQPNNNYVEVSDVRRQAVRLSNLPEVPYDGADLLLWRTVGDGSIFFLVRSILTTEYYTTRTFTDVTSDYFGLGDEVADILTNTEISFDNIKPFATFEFCAGPHYGRMFWCGDTSAGNQGRLFYSAPGRPEGVEGFIDVTSTDDQSQALAIWNGSIYCFVESGVYEILGTTTPFIPRLIYGAPGTTHPHSITVTPQGVVYTAHDGVRIFTGNASELLYFEAVSRIMSQETRENIAGFVPIWGAYGRDEVVMGDGIVTMACNLKTGRWREIGVAAQSGFYAADLGEIIMDFASDFVALLETPNTANDVGVPIAFDVKLVETMLDPHHKIRVDLLSVDANFAGQQVTVSIFVDGVETTLGAESGATRVSYEFPIDQSGRLVSARFVGSLSAIIEIFHVKVKVSIKGEPQELELFDPQSPDVGLWSGYGPDIAPRFGLMRAKGLNRLRTQTIRSRTGSQLHFDTGGYL
jgi:hypothetical protein